MAPSTDVWMRRRLEGTLDVEGHSTRGKAPQDSWQRYGCEARGRVPGVLTDARPCAARARDAVRAEGRAHTDARPFAPLCKLRAPTVHWLQSDCGAGARL